MMVYGIIPSMMVSGIIPITSWIAWIAWLNTHHNDRNESMDITAQCHSILAIVGFYDSYDFPIIAIGPSSTWL